MRCVARCSERKTQIGKGRASSFKAPRKGNAGRATPDAEGASLATPGNVELRAEESSPLSFVREPVGRFNGHSQKFLSRITVVPNCRFIDRKEPQRRRIVYPHRQRFTFSPPCRYQSRPFVANDDWLEPCSPEQGSLPPTDESLNRSPG